MGWGSGFGSSWGFGDMFSLSLYSGEKVRCHGTAISRKLLVTTGKCATAIKNDADENKVVVPGISHAHDDDGIKTRIVKYFIHPKYDDKTGGDNIAIVKLSSKLKFHKNSSAIKIPKSDDKLKPGTKGVVPLFSLLPVKKKPSKEDTKAAKDEDKYPTWPPLWTQQWPQDMSGSLKNEIEDDVKNKVALIAGLKVSIHQFDNCTTLFSGETKTQENVRGVSPELCTDFCCDIGGATQNMREGCK